MLGAAKALSYLHSRALVHGGVEPAAILAVGDQIKLSTAGIAPSVDSGDGVMSAADDLRGLGESIHAMFTRNTEIDLEHLSAIPQPFRDIVRGCYRTNLRDPWTAQRVVAALDLPAVPAPLPAPARPTLEWVPVPQLPEQRKQFPVWVVAPAIVAVIFLVFILTRKPQPAAPPPAPIPARAVIPAPVKPPQPLPSPLGPAIPEPVREPKAKPTDVASSRIWRVVSYTYSKAEDAARMVHEINRKWPHLQAEEFSPAGSGPPYYVAIGGRMTRSEAVRVQQRAISTGLPPDTFVRNFRR